MCILPRPHVLTVAAIVLLATGSPALAQTEYSWNYTGSGWHTAANWSPNGVPTAADTAVLGPFDGTTLTLPSLSGNAAVSQFRILGPRPFYQGTLSGNGNTLTVGSGGVMSTAAFTERATFGSTLTISGLTVNVANGTSFTNGFAQSAGAVDLSGFGSQLDLTSGSQLRLVNAANNVNYDLSINGGAQIRVNAGTQITNGVGVNSAAQGEIRFHGGGTLSFQGANDTASTFNANQIVAASGHGRVGVFAGQDTVSAGTPSVTLNLGNGTLQRGIDRFSDVGGSFQSLGTGTIEFNFNGVIPGFTGSQAQLVFRPGSTGVPMLNGVIVQNPSSNGNSPYVILTGTVPGISGTTGRFATWNSSTGAVTAQVGTPRDESNLSAVAANENVIYRPSSTSANATLSTSIAPQTIVFEPRTSNQSVNLNSNTITTPGILVERSASGTGEFHFNLTGPGSLTSPGGSQMNIYVLGASNTFFNVGADFTNSNGFVVGVAKSGTGTMVLTGNTPQMNSMLDVYINQGAIRARIDGANANFGTTNILHFRGGVLEVDANGGTSTFSRGLGTGYSQVSWNFGTSMVADRGGGGFGVVNGNLNVNIGGAGQTLVWNGTAGNNSFFLRSGQPLVLGSFQQNGILTLQNNLALDDGSAGLPPESREILADSFSSGIQRFAERSRITGVISGSSATGLMKAGRGMLELTAANTYAGGTSVGLGTLLVNNTTGSGTGTGLVIVYDTLLGNGTIAPSSGNGLTTMPNSYLGLYRDQLLGTPGHMKVGTAGLNNPVTLRSGANAIFQLNGTNFDTNGGSTSYGRLTVRGTGAVTVDGAILTIGVNLGFTPSNTDVFGIIDNQTSNAITGMFAGIGEGGIVNAVFTNNAPAGTFLLTYQGNITESGISISGGNDIVLYNFAPVPEPTMVIGLCASAAGLSVVFGRLRRSVRPA